MRVRWVSGSMAALSEIVSDAHVGTCLFGVIGPEKVEGQGPDDRVVSVAEARADDRFVVEEGREAPEIPGIGAGGEDIVVVQDPVTRVERSDAQGPVEDMGVTETDERNLLVHIAAGQAAAHHVGEDQRDIVAQQCPAIQRKQERQPVPGRNDGRKMQVRRAERRMRIPDPFSRIIGE